MPRSRSRSRDRKRRSRSRDKDRKRRDRERRRSRSRSHEKTRDKSERDRRRSRSRTNERRDRERDRKRRDRSKSHDRRERHRSRSHERKDRHRDRHSSDSSEKKHSQGGSVVNSAATAAAATSTNSGSVKPIVIIANTHSKGSKHRSNAESIAQRNRDHREIFEISNEFSREGFEQFGRDHGIDFTNIETDEDREAVHEKMQELLKAHFAAQGIVYPPPPKEDKQPAINAATGFANDGSFLEQFKRIQEEQKQQAEMEQKRQAESLLNLPIRRRRGGKILKTGVVAKTKLSNQERSSADVPSNAWGMYIKEVQKYKGSSCDSDSKNRPLVK